MEIEMEKVKREMEIGERDRGRDGGKINFIINILFYLFEIEYNKILL